MREKLIELLMDMPSGNSTYEEEERRMEAVADYLIANGVTIPVRCKDCIYWEKATANKKGFLICTASGMEIMADDFCSCGERRTDDG